VQRSLRNFFVLVLIAVAATVPALALRSKGWAPDPFLDAVLFGIAILAAGFMLSWSAETAETRFSPVSSSPLSP
jgi:cation:H+ antiporter